MGKNLYEFYISFGRRDINSAFLLDVERETEKFYFGDVVLLDKKNGEPVAKYGRFRVEKDRIDSARIHRDAVLVARVFGDSFEEAKDTAFTAFARMSREWADTLDNFLKYIVPLNERLENAEERCGEVSCSREAKDAYEIG